MAKKEIYFECEACGAKSPKWLGRCPSCSAWDSFVEVKEEGETTFPILQEKSQKLSNIKEKDFRRISTEISEFDRILGGGIVEGSTILLGGDPGVGKSTLLLQALGNIGKSTPVLYSSAEESLRQIADRGRRISKDSENLEIISTTSLENIIKTAEEKKVSLLVVDSIQTVFLEKVPASPGSLAQIREASFTLTQFAKTKNIAVFVVGHITKEGIISGPKALEHIVDVVLYLEGDNYKNLKVLRAQKNRFGTTNEIALFDMTESGLKEVVNPSEILLKDRMVEEPGSSIGVSVEGTRAFLFEIQSLFSPSAFGLAKRMSVGFDRNRMQLLTAVIERATKIMMGDKDIYLNLVGGIEVEDPGLDLPVCLSIISTLKGKPLPEDIASFGEVGLLGEVRATSHPLKRIKEAQAHGFKKVLLPKSDYLRSEFKDKSLQLISVSSLKEAIKLLE